MEPGQVSESWEQQRKRLEDCLPSLGKEPIGLAIAAALARIDNLQQTITENVDEGIAENHAIMTLTGVPRAGYTLQREIRAQLEELQAEIRSSR